MLDIVHNYIEKLSVNKPIEIVLDYTILTPARLEMAEKYKREYHLIRHNSSEFVDHLIMHELTHLDFIYQAREHHKNVLFTTNNFQKEIFLHDNKDVIKKLTKYDFSVDKIHEYMNMLFVGINSQIYNCPIDLFIEDKLYNEHPSLRDIQSKSIDLILDAGIESTTLKNSIKLLSAKIASANKILNMVSAMQYNDLFGRDYVSRFKMSKDEIRRANYMYEEFKEYNEDREPGEEYELVQNWGSDLGLDKYFTLMPDKT